MSQQVQLFKSELVSTPNIKVYKMSTEPSVSSTETQNTLSDDFCHEKALFGSCTTPGVCGKSGRRHDINLKKTNQTWSAEKRIKILQLFGSFL